MNEEGVWGATEHRTGCRQPLDRGDVSAASCILYSLSDPGPDRIRKLLRWNPIFGYRRPHVLHSSSIEVDYGFQHSSIKANARRTQSPARQPRALQEIHVVSVWSFHAFIPPRLNWTSGESQAGRCRTSHRRAFRRLLRQLSASSHHPRVCGVDSQLTTLSFGPMTTDPNPVVMPVAPAPVSRNPDHTTVGRTARSLDD
jgi:hypothetical protein